MAARILYIRPDSWSYMPSSPKSGVQIHRKSFMRPRIRKIPSGPARAVATYVRNREEGSSKKQLRHLMDANRAVSALREMNHKSPEFKHGLEIVRATVAGQLAMTAKTDDVLHDFLKTKKFIYINSGARLVGTNWPKILGMGRERIFTSDILWLANHL